MKKVLVIDTCILCIWIEVPGMKDCGPDDDKWDKERVSEKLINEEKEKTTFVLPLATIIETGNHISQATNYRYEKAQTLTGLISKSLKQESPWAAFSEQSSLWTSEKLGELVDVWPPLAGQKISLGDATIKDVAEYYACAGFDVEILTGDQGLKSYEPAKPIQQPRRRKQSS
ncbi:MAG: hypothetical protein MI794_10640 [Pseudomonadales bacterium]|nr:hypothetical protein [Pseudomonadales bacterium]